MFIDRIKVRLRAGKGGNGVVAWRREKCLPKGGPYGGNGGRGGSITLKVDPSFFSLESYRNRRLIKGENGRSGGTNLRQGRSGKNLILKVPFGTLVKDPSNGEIFHDFTPEHTVWEACIGGKGGRGNAAFKTSTRRAPNVCTLGKPGEEREIELELKLIADVGLVGMPNAGKSTLLSTITHTRVKIGAYPFTTLTPKLSYVQCEDYRRILLADIPGIIQDAHLNRGLGIEFLRHIERTTALVFVIDASGQEERIPFEDFTTLRHEIEKYQKEMLDKPFLVALNKCDIPESQEHIAHFRSLYPFDPTTLIEISALEDRGLNTFVQRISDLTLPQIVESQHPTT